MPPQFAYGDMLAPQTRAAADLTLITTNGCLDAAGRLVMGAGIARQARDRWPALAAFFGYLVSQRLPVTPPEAHFEQRGRTYQLYAPYYLLVYADVGWGIFQVKQRFDARADLDLLHTSVTHLVAWCAAQPHARVHLNYPGIGCGGLAKAAVAPLLDALPPTVTVWEWGGAR